MMGILARFRDIMSSNINALLDKAEDPEKMIDQYLRNLNSDLGKVKAETASIMAEEARAKRQVDEATTEINKMTDYARKALEAGNEDDARKFLEKKAKLAENQVQLQASYDIAAQNSEQMKQMHDKLVGDLNELESRQSMLKGKAAVAKTQKRMNQIGASVAGANNTVSAFDRMEAKIDKSLDEAKAMAELNKGPEDGVKDLAAKYDNDSSSVVEDELAALKAEMNL